MDQGWVREERRLWDAMMGTGRRRKTVILHGIQPGPVRNELLKELEKQRQKSVADEWKSYASWVRHLPP